MTRYTLADARTLVRNTTRDLPGGAARGYARVKEMSLAARWKAAGWIAPRTDTGGLPGDPGGGGPAGSSGGLAGSSGGLAGSSGGLTGDPDDMTKDELMDLARRADVPGRSKMTKTQLAAALRKRPRR